MGNTKDFVQTFIENARLADEYNTKAQIALTNYIYEVQQKFECGFVKFNDNIGYPYFNDEETNCLEAIFGVKVVGD